MLNKVLEEIKNEEIYVVIAQAKDSEVEKAVQYLIDNTNFKVVAVSDGKSFSSDMERVEQIESSDVENMAAVQASKLFEEGKKVVLMKGMTHTAKFLKAVLKKENNLRVEGNLLSHLGVFDFEGRLLGLADAALNIKPDLEQKVKIIKNSVDAFIKLGVENPKVALLAAVETVNEKMPETLDAAAISLMNKRGQIKNCIVDGPLGFDNAINLEAAKHKKIESEVAGRADILVAPEISAANILYKSFTFVAKLEMAGVVLGAKIPLTLTSRADNWEHKYKSVLLAARLLK